MWSSTCIHLDGMLVLAVCQARSIQIVPRRFAAAYVCPTPIRCAQARNRFVELQHLEPSSIDMPQSFVVVPAAAAACWSLVTDRCAILALCYELRFVGFFGVAYVKRLC